MQRQTLRTAVPLTRISTPQQAPAFHAFVQGLLTQSTWKEFRDYQG
jgi:cullin-associated NEDD8-dissociated protein 1